jgi:MFS family permease
LLVAGRALQGLSAAIIAPAALSMVMNAFPEGAERNRALGVWGGLGGIGATAGLLLGGLITETFGWPWVFWINLPVGLAVLALAPAVLRESRGPARGRPFDLAGAAMVTLAMTLLVYAITRRPAASPARTAGLLAGAAVAAVAAALFVLVERHSAAPLLPVRALRSRPLLGGNLVILLAGMTVDGMLVTLTAYGQQVLGWSALRFGLVTAVMTVTSVAGALVSQRRRRAPAYGAWRSRVRPCSSALLAPASSTTLILLALLVFEHSGLAAGLVRVIMGSSAFISMAALLMLSRFATATLPIVRCGVESGCSPR